MKYDIIFFPWRDWNKMNDEGFRTREANILIELSKREDVNSILCVNRSKLPGYVRKALSIMGKQDFSFGAAENSNDYFDFNESIKYKRLFSDLKKVNEKIFVLDIDYHLPNPRGNKLERMGIFKKILKQQITEAIGYLGFKNYLVWCFDITKVEIANYFKKDTLIFDAIDNLLEHDSYRNDREFLKNQYLSVSENADYIFTVSEALKKDVFQSMEKAEYIPNGINLELYTDKDNKYKANDLPTNKPIVGYVGLMQERIDVVQLENVVDELGDECNFVFVGPVLTSNIFSNLKSKKNVYFIGSKHHSLIPSYIKEFDICIIPHKVNNFTKSMNPLKLYEYLAATKETITTPVPPSDEFDKIVHIVQETNDMGPKIKEILREPFSKFSEEEITKRIKEETWSSRVQLMMEKISQ
ncbi:hypothetical protein ABER68_00720 [Paenibacillus alvei]